MDHVGSRDGPDGGPPGESRAGACSGAGSTDIANAFHSGEESGTVLHDEMIELPAGTFRMGSADFYVEEGPVREITVDAFVIDRGPVTVSR